MSLPDLFKQKGALASLRPANLQQRQAEGAPSAVPQLLQRLEMAMKTAELDPANLQQHTSWGLAKLQLNAHRQVFAMFLASMTTYRPLLLRIKAAYDTALDDSLQAANDQAHLLMELAAMPRRHAEAVAAAQEEAAAAGTGMTEELSSKLLELRQQTQQVEQECSQIDEQLHHYQKHVTQARREVDQLEVSNRRAFKELLDNSSWPWLDSMQQQQQLPQQQQLQQQQEEEEEPPL